MGIMKEKAKKMKETKNCSKVKIKNSKERGITLIALIVTIIVLLILAGVLNSSYLAMVQMNKFEKI